ncbi:hypothetical protein [Suttonella indologenes]|uniref:hypothetical protein n=1 Tax=Suttonella indologenes TaxID=13276 RepID=UPI001559B94F|nr:hypothetical protein [Suttonella indologenes]
MPTTLNLFAIVNAADKKPRVSDQVNFSFLFITLAAKVIIPKAPVNFASFLTIPSSYIPELAAYKPSDIILTDLTLPLIFLSQSKS